MYKYRGCQAEGVKQRVSSRGCQAEGVKQRVSSRGCQAEGAKQAVMIELELKVICCESYKYRAV